MTKLFIISKISVIYIPNVPQKGNETANKKLKNGFSEVDTFIIDKFKGLKINDLL